MRARASVAVPGRVSDAEALWYDLRRWPGFVDGLAHVERTEGDWPRAGARVLWRSAPGGRGLVAETVTAHTVREGQTVAVEDAKVRGTQTVRFAPGAVAVELELALKERNLLAAPFVRRALAESLRRTLARFARELRGDLELAGERHEHGAG